MRPIQILTILLLGLSLLGVAAHGSAPQGKTPQPREKAAALASVVVASPDRQSAGAYDRRTWSRFWSLRPLRQDPVPHVADARWSSSPIDAFVYAHLRDKGLVPAPPADKATLIRRATFDMLGLPPTAPEVRAFLADTSPDAYAHLIDRLLASPHYGEKYGRHWLDVARYTPGRIAFPGIRHAAGDSAYRDYVVRAFNADKPYDQFVIEQLAGDLLPPSADRQQEFDQITAPAFLSIGPWFDMCTDPNRLRMEMIDDQINVTGKAFLGLSINCARCHDHKFDPIPTADYYALAGIFRSTKIVGGFSEYWRDGRVRLLRPLAMPDEVAADDALRKKIDAAKARQWAFLTDRHADHLALWQKEAPRYRAAAAGIERPWTRPFEAEDFDGIYNIRVAELSQDGKVVQVIETLNPVQQWVRYKFDVPDSAIYRLDALYSADEKCPVELDINGVPTTDSGLADATGGWDLQYRKWQTVGSFELHAGLNFLRLTRKEGNFPRIDKFRLFRINDHFDAAIEQAAKVQDLSAPLLARYVKNPDHPLPAIAEMADYLSADETATLQQFEAAQEKLAAGLSSHALVVAVTDQPVPTDMPVHMRGSVDVPPDAPPIPRGVPRLLDGVVPRPAVAPSASGRLELARWIVDPRNPLTARVIVNRVWQWHFGQGLVTTASDFGSRGAPPTHPELLDWLAADFIAHGNSLKHLHRQIMLSQAYQMSGEASAATVAADPDDRDLTRFAPRRLEAEELYDAMFACTNVLIRQESGKPLDLQKSLGRAMYVLTTNRAPPGLGAEVRKMLALFDLDLTGATIDHRPASATPAQSLFWLNNPLPQYFAGKFATRLLKMDKLTDRQRVDQAYLIAISHPPDDAVRQAALDYVDQLQSQGKTPEQAWSALCEAIFASDAFHRVE